MATKLTGVLFSDKTIGSSGVVLTKMQIKLIRSNYYPQEELIALEGDVYELTCANVFMEVCQDPGMYYQHKTGKPKVRRMEALKNLTCSIMGHAIGKVF